MKLEQLPDVSCTCQKCKDMCKRPCWPTPSEVRAMMAAGLADKLMLDYWIGSPDVFIVCPSNPGYGGGRAPEAEGWTGGALTSGCIFQDKDGLCSIHGTFKPIEGRLATHDMEIPLHKMVMETWNTDEGRAVVEEWSNLVGLENVI